jgi:hypothetical protein
VGVPVRVGVGVGAPDAKTDKLSVAELQRNVDLCSGFIR